MKICNKYFHVTVRENETSILCCDTQEKLHLPEGQLRELFLLLSPIYEEDTIAAFTRAGLITK